MGTSGDRDCQWASRSVLKDFTGGALTFSGDSLFQHVTAQIVKVPTTSLLMELVGVATWSFEGWMCEAGRHTSFQNVIILALEEK